jgi:DNA polymerase-1
MSSTTAQSELPISSLDALRRLLREVTTLGVEFRISGADVEISHAGHLPASLQAALEQHRASGLLHDYLDGDHGADAAFDLLDQLNAAAVLVETRAGARQAVREILEHLRQPAARQPIGIDIETTPLPPYRQPAPPVRLNRDGALSAQQPTANKDRAGLSPHTARIATLQLYAGGDRCFVLRGDALALLLASHWLRRQWLVAHNATFETAFLRHHTRSYRPPPGRKPRGRLDCSMQATGLLCGTEFGGGRSLADAAKTFLHLNVSKEVRRSDWGAERLSQGQLAYAAADAVLAHRLWPLLAHDMVRDDRMRAYTLQHGAIPAVTEMELRGVLLDRAAHTALTNEWSHELALARKLYQQATGQPPPSTPSEVRDWLSEVLDGNAIERWPRTDTGQLSITTPHLKRLTHIPNARPVLAIIAHEKLLRNFGVGLAALINPATERLHAHYNIAGAKSGRFTCTNPNLQQLPSRRAPAFRRCIVAAPGCLLVGCDWNQVELRAIAWLSDDPVLTALYAHGRDLHREIAAQIVGIPLDAVTKEQRQGAKAVAFGSVYGIGPRSLVESAFVSYGVTMTEAEAKQALDAFFRRFPTLDRWRRDYAAICQAQGRVVIGAGRVVEAAWEPSGQITFPQACNLPVQGICADAMLRAIALVQRRFIAAGIRGGLVATVHDELLAEVAEDDAERARDLLQAAMTDAFVATFPGAPTTGVAKALIGRSWLEVKG